MNTIPAVCPFCHGEIYVTQMVCHECDTHIEGRFTVMSLSHLKPAQLEFVERFVARLDPEQLAFVETFVRCEGKLKSMESELGLSYPTIRNRLNEVVVALGFEPDLEEAAPPAGVSEEVRLSILEDLDSGKISAAEAMRLLAKES